MLKSFSLNSFDINKVGVLMPDVTGALQLLFSCEFREILKIYPASTSELNL